MSIIAFANMTAPVPEAPTQAPDFSTWSRATLEQFATDVNNRNLQLQADLRLALDETRGLTTELADAQADLHDLTMKMTHAGWKHD